MEMETSNGDGDKLAATKGASLSTKCIGIYTIP